jgi:NAD(P)-dependent dehydrogenase (short-subunit alcohol dehydrogenase family)
MADFTDTLFDLTGRTALVTGGSRGIGRAITERLAQHGANVAILVRNAVLATSVADGINSRSGGRAIALSCNITRTGELDQACATLSDAFGNIDILVAAMSPLNRPSRLEIRPATSKVSNGLALRAIRSIFRRQTAMG